MLLISADLDELIGLSDRLKVILRGRFVAEVDPAHGHARGARLGDDRCGGDAGMSARFDPRRIARSRWRRRRSPSAFAILDHQPGAAAAAGDPVGQTWKTILDVGLAAPVHLADRQLRDGRSTCPPWPWPSASG